MIRGVAAEDRRTVIVGATAPEIVKLIEAINSAEKHQYEIEGFLDDNPERAGQMFMGYSVLGATTLLSCPYRNFCVVNNVGSTTAARKRVWRKMREAGAGRFPVLAHHGSICGTWRSERGR
jgi:FlaA1/EpsC-like NDP-sugar epimerase